jgi:AMMECR1 domain-containing protein
VFASLHDPPGPNGDAGRLRGCRGSVDAHAVSLEAEVSFQAVLAATDDPRCEPVRLAEVDRLDITVYVLGPLEPVDGVGALDPPRFGVLVRGESGRAALLLPGLPGIDDPGVQLALTRRKARLSPGEPVRLFRFAADILR